MAAQKLLPKGKDVHTKQRPDGADRLESGSVPADPGNPKQTRWGYGTIRGVVQWRTEATVGIRWDAMKQRRIGNMNVNTVVPRFAKWNESCKAGFLLPSTLRP